jgi:hypothetical protein
MGLLSGCLNRDRLLKPDQYLLYSQTIKGNKKVPEGELTPFYRQTANRRPSSACPSCPTCGSTRRAANATTARRWSED